MALRIWTLAHLEDCYRAGLTVRVTAEAVDVAPGTVGKCFRQCRAEGVPRGPVQRRPYGSGRPYTGSPWIGRRQSACP